MPLLTVLQIFITLKFREADAGSSDADDLITTQYKGKENLKPIFDQLLCVIRSLGLMSKLHPKNRP